MTENGRIPLKRMQLILTGIILLSIILFSLIAGIISVIVLETTLSFEEEEVENQIERFSDTINLSMMQISRTAEDYGTWDETALFIQGKNQEYPEAQISVESLDSMGIDIFALISPDGNRIFFLNISPGTSETDPDVSGLSPYLSPGSPLIISRENPVAHQVFATGTHAGILVSSPVTFHTRREDTGGTLIMGRYFSEGFLDELSLMSKSPLLLLNESQGMEIFGLEDPDHPDIRVQVLNKTVIDSYIRIRDPVSGRYLVFSLPHHRDIYTQSVSALYSYLGLIALIIIGFSVLSISGLTYYFRHADSAEREAIRTGVSYNRIIEEIGDAYFRADPDGVLERVSPSALMMLGYQDEAELVGRSIRDLFQNPDERTMLRSILFENQEIRDHPLFLRRKDDSLVFVTVQVHLLTGDDGSITGMEGLAHDNTSVLMAGSVRGEEESVYRLVFESANIGLFQSSPERRFISVNPAFSSMMGYSGPEAMRAEVTDISVDLYENPAEFRRIHERLRASGSVTNLETSLKRKNGTIIQVTLNLVLIRDIEEKPVAFFGTIIDITDRMEMEKELMQSQQKFRSLFELSPIAIMVHDAAGVLIDENPAAATLFGTPEPGLLAGISLFQLPFLNDENRGRIHSRQIINTETEIDFDLLAQNPHLPITRTGTGFLHVRITPIPHPFKAGTGLFLTQIIDITERRRAENERVISEMKYRQVFSHVSHGLILFELSEDGLPGRIIDINPKAEDLVQRRRDEILRSGDSITRHIPISRADLNRGSSGRSEDICSFESVILQDDKPVLIQVTLTFFSLGKQTVGISIIEDITGKKKQEEEKLNMIHLIEKNLAELSILNDGIRNPLTIIMMLADELDPGISRPILSQIRNIDDLINQLDRRWVESDKILQYLQKHHHIQFPSIPGANPDRVYEE